MCMNAEPSWVNPLEKNKETIKQVGNSVWGDTISLSALSGDELRAYFKRCMGVFPSCVQRKLLGESIEISVDFDLEKI